MAQALLAGAKSACAICWKNIILHSHPEIEISFKFIPKILMSKECRHFFGPLCIQQFAFDGVHITYFKQFTFFDTCIQLRGVQQRETLPVATQKVLTRSVIL